MLVNFPQNPERLNDFELQHVPAVWLMGPETVRVLVGEKQHSMDPEHYIEWVELYDGKERLARVELTPERRPEIVIDTGGRVGYFTARAYCSQHGLWQSGWA